MNVFILKADCVKTIFICARKFVNARIVQKKKIHSCPRYQKNEINVQLLLFQIFTVTVYYT